MEKTDAVREDYASAVKRLVARLLCAESPEYVFWYSCGCGGNSENVTYPCDKHLVMYYSLYGSISKCKHCGSNHITDEQRARLLVDINLED